MTDKEPKEIHNIRQYQSKLISKTLIKIGVVILIIGLINGFVHRASLTLLRIKCIQTADFKTSTQKHDSVLISKIMIDKAINNSPIDKNRFAQGFIPYLFGNNIPLFTTNYSIKKPLFLTNFFSNGDIGFLKVNSKTDTVSIDLYRHSFDYNTIGKESILISLSQLDSNDNFNISYYPDKNIVINNTDTIILYSLGQMNKAISNYEIEK